MKKTILLLCLYSTISMPGPSWAQVLTEQGKIIHTIKPGDTITGTLNIHNTSKDSLPIKAYWEEFRYNPPFNATKEFLPAGTTPNSAVRWINFSPDKFNLPPFSKQVVSYTINVPKDVQGGYYAVLFFEREDNQLIETTGIRIVSRVGSLFFLETADSVRKAAIDAMTLKNQTLSGQLQNQGNVILIPEGTFYVMNSGNLVVDRGQLPGIYLPPSEKADFQVNLKKDLPPGQYTIVLTLDLHEGNVLVKEIDFDHFKSGGSKILKIRD